MLKTAIKRPITVFMIVFIVMLLGLYLFLRIPVDLFPDLDMPVVTVTTKYPGASPVEVEQQVTSLIEEEMSDLENLDTISSTSSQNVSSIMIQFDWGTDINVAETRVRSKLETIMGELPSAIEDPVVQNVNPSDSPVVEMVLAGDRDLKELTIIADEQVKEELQKVTGVSSIQIFGGRENEVVIALDQQKMKHLGISLGTIQETLMKDNLSLSIGTVEEGNKILSVKTSADIAQLEQLEKLPIPGRQGTTVQLQDLGHIFIREKETDQSSLYNGKNTVSIFVFKQNGTNTIEVADRIKKKVEELKPELQGVDLVITSDSSDFISHSIKNLTKEGVIGATLATVILYFFLGELAATLVIALAIPISIVTTFLFMYFQGLTINLVTLGALTLSIGLMVDDAIVVLQNIYRHYREEGKKVFQAAVDGVREVASAVFSATMTKMIVFLPMLFVGGMAGQIFKPLAYTVIYGLLASLIVSFTVTPTLTALLLAAAKKVPFLRGKSRLSEKLVGIRRSIEDGYRKLLVRVLNHRKKVFVMALVSFIAGAGMLTMVGKEFMPRMDAGEFTIHVEMPPDTRIEETEKVVASILDKIEQIEEKESVFVGLGSTKNNRDYEQSDKAYLTVTLKDRSERDRSTGEIIESLRNRLVYPGVDLKFEEASFIVSSLFSSDPVFISIKGENLQVLDRISADITRIVRDVPGVRDPDNSFSGRKREYVIRFDRDKLKFYGLDVLSVSQFLKTSTNGDVIGELATDTGDIDIRVMYEPQDVRTIQDVSQLLIPTPRGWVPLETFMILDQAQSPSDIYRENQLRMSFVTAGLYQSDLGTVVSEIEKELKDYPLPPGYTIEFGGETKDMRESFGDLGTALILAIVLIYAVMVAEFESFKHPFIIMFTIPLTLFGISASLLLFGRNLSVSSILGIIMLSGIIVSNGIVMIEFMKQLREQGMDAYQTVLKAGPIRLTPVLMTTGTAVLGVLPIALGLGEGSEMNAPMATVVLGGLTVGTLLTLFVIPALYYAMEKNRPTGQSWIDYDVSADSLSHDVPS
ncbi:MAG: efflux RND transporter permease subunit [Bacillaceae bacterium]|nr:efflux RND transporter permease subunit [Bacillaceae bacterium]